jgi:tetratricopeptide (TPR) repeat protein
LALLAATLLGAFLFYLRHREWNAAKPYTLVLLPFDNRSGDSSNAYLAEGLTDALDVELSKVAALRVVRGVRKPYAELTRELHPDAVMDSTVNLSGKAVFVSVKVTQPALNSTAWSKDYQSPKSDLPAVQRQIAREVTGSLQVRMTPEERAELNAIPPVNQEAYDAYLRGRQYWTRQTMQDLRKAADEFRRSIEESPNYAPAYAGLADCYSMLGWFGAFSPLDVLDAARAASNKAVQLDPGLAESYISLAIVNGFYDWDWQAAETNLKRALSLNPSLADAHHWYAHMLEAVGRPDEGLSELKLAHELDALYPLINEDLTLAYFCKRDYDTALAYANKLIALQPDFWRVHNLRGKIYREKRMFEEAVTEFELTARLSDHNMISSASLAHIYAANGRTTEARAILSDLLNRANKSFVDPEPIAEIYLGLREKDEALKWLNKACSIHIPRFAWLAKREPLFDIVRDDPRFQKLLEKMHL